MGEFDPDIMQRIIEKGDTLLFRNNYFVPKGSGDWKRSNAVIDSLGVRAGVKKAQDGTTLTRRDAINALRNKGFSRSQARLAYQNQKNALRNNGFFGDEMRQAARRNIVESAHPRAIEETPNIEPMPTVPQINMPSNKLIASDPGIAPITRSGRPDVITFSGQSFGEAFNNARKMGLSEFAWQGGEYDRYHTGLENKSFIEGVRDKNEQRVEARDNMIQSAVTQAKTAPKWWQRLGNAFMAGTLVNE